MKIDYTNMKKNLLMEQKGLLNELEKLEKFLTSETIDLLRSIILLEESVFRAEEFGKVFGKLDLFWEIAKYNITNRTVKTIEGIPSVDQEKFRVYFMNDRLDITYQMEDNFFFVFKSVFEKEHTLNVYTYDKTKEKYLETYTESLKRMPTHGFDKDLSFVGEGYKGKAIFESVVDEANAIKSMKATADKHVILESVEAMKNCGHEKFDVSNKVSSALLDDWGILLDGKTRRLEKRMSWITVLNYKR